jgi:tetratricopeptide (TPR) repeat protein
LTHREETAIRPRWRKLALGTGLAIIGALSINWNAVQSWYDARLPVDDLVRRAERSPEDLQAAERAAARLLEAGRPGEARRLLEPQTPAHGDDLTLQLLLGRACLETGSLREAYAHLMVALMLDPRSADAHWWLAETLRQQERTAEAMEHYRRVTELAPRRGEAWLRLGARALAANQHAAALDPLVRADELLHSGEAARLRAQALWKLGRLPEASRPAREAAAREPGAASWLLLGQVLAASPHPAQWREAVTWLQRAAAQEPGNHEARRELGLAYGQVGNWHGAVRELRAHLRLYPGAARSYPPLAQAYRALSREDMAVRVLRIYHQLEPVELKTAQAEYRVAALKRAPEARLALARTYAACGLEDRAREELQQLVGDHPGYLPAARMLAALLRGRSLVIPPLPPDPEADR